MVKGKSTIRIWENVTAAYKALAEQIGAYPSDLISAVALLTPFLSPTTFALALNIEYGVPLGKGLRIAKELRVLLKNTSLAYGINTEITKLFDIHSPEHHEQLLSPLTRGKRIYAKHRPGKPGSRDGVKQK